VLNILLEIELVGINI